MADLVAQYGPSLKRFAKVAKNLGPLGVKADIRIKCKEGFRQLFGYAAHAEKTDKKMGEQIRKDLEFLIGELEKTYDVLENYTEEQKIQSNLAFEVKLSYTACMCWAQSWQDEKRKPTEIEKSLPRKIARLQKAIALETVDFIRQAGADFKKVQQHMVDKETPQYYYKKGLELIRADKPSWLEAKDNFLQYRRLLLAGKPGCISPPYDDEHLHYLSWIQDQIETQNKESPDPVLSVVPSGKAANEYKKLELEWKKKYPKPPKSTTSSGYSSSSSSSSSFSTSSKEPYSPTGSK